MGAQAFCVIGHGSDADVAFCDAVGTAQAEIGDAYPDGYSGTIVEKSTFYEFHLPGGWENRPASDVATLVDDLFDWLLDSRPGRPSGRLLEVVDAPVAEKIVTTFDDKWGPAIAFRVAADRWAFMGWASC